MTLKEVLEVLLTRPSSIVIVTKATDGGDPVWRIEINAKSGEGCVIYVPRTA